MSLTADRLRPVPGRVLIRRIRKDEQTAGGIYLPDQSRDVSQAGVIVATGEGVATVTPGDDVVFSMWAAVPCVATSDGDDLVFVREADLLAIVEREGQRTQHSVHSIETEFVVPRDEKRHEMLVELTRLNEELGLYGKP